MRHPPIVGALSHRTGGGRGCASSQPARARVSYDAGMRLAIFADVHGNSIALDAVLAAIAAAGEVDGYWVLGDLVAQGFDPAGAAARLAALPNAAFVRGNTDRYVLRGERARPSLAEAQADPQLMPVLVSQAMGFAWTHGALSATGWLPWLKSIPEEQRLTLPDGTRLLGVHGAPGDDEAGIDPQLTDAELARLVAGCEADLVCVGHTHWPLDRHVGGIRVVNVGSVSNPWAPDLRASYALLDADASGYQLMLHRAAYDTDAVIDAVRRSHLFPPAGKDWLIERFLGRRVPPWVTAPPRQQLRPD